MACNIVKIAEWAYSSVHKMSELLKQQMLMYRGDCRTTPFFQCTENHFKFGWKHKA